jgi:hypothetical protein
MNTLLSVKIYSFPFTMYIAAGTYTAPPSADTTGNFKISILRNGFPMQVGYQTITAASTTLSGSLTERGNEIVNKVTTYTFSVTITDALSPTGKLRLKFPTSVQLSAITSTTCAQLIGTNLADSPVCTVNPTLKTI